MNRHLHLLGGDVARCFALQGVLFAIADANRQIRFAFAGVLRRFRFVTVSVTRCFAFPAVGVIERFWSLVVQCVLLPLSGLLPESFLGDKLLRRGSQDPGPALLLGETHVIPAGPAV